jgi:DNA-directed RNA polymerase subunit M/transcription elongation factor TFIIS
MSLLTSVIRENARKALGLTLSVESNIIILENKIFEISDENESVYKQIIFQLIVDIRNGKKLKELLEDLKQNKVHWKHQSLNEYIDEEVEQDNFIIQPFEIVEGITECKCGSKRVYSFTKQTRGGDESSTTFNECLNCKSKWSYCG